MVKKLLSFYFSGWKLRLIMFGYDVIKKKILKEINKKHDTELDFIKNKRKEVIGKAYKKFKHDLTPDEFLTAIERVQNAREILRGKRATD